MNRHLVVPLLVAASLAGCARLSEVGQAPAMSRIENPATLQEARTVSLPMPAPLPMEQDSASLWRTGARSFLRDQRAKITGDILTVLIDIEDRAQLQNQTQRRRANSESAGIPSFFGFQSRLPAILPDAVDPENLVELESGSSSTGSGSVNRQERITLRVAAVITQVLPNGNLVIAGRQEVRVNFELRELRIAGVIRPEDISNGNAIEYDKIAEARISYGGRGQITDVQQPRYGQQVFDIIMPW
jgi:flagellar L-ring protein precursor FlgH